MVCPDTRSRTIQPAKPAVFWAIRSYCTPRPFILTQPLAKPEPAWLSNRSSRYELNNRLGSAIADAKALPSRRGRNSFQAAHPFASSIRETSAADNSPEPGRQYLRDTVGQRAIGDYLNDSLACSIGSPSLAMSQEWKNGTPIPKRHVFCSEDCGTTTRNMHAFPHWLKNRLELSRMRRDCRIRMCNSSLIPNRTEAGESSCS